MPGEQRTRPAPPAAPENRNDASDEDRLVAAAQADRRAFAPLYRRYADSVYRYCYRRLGSKEAAEDATSLVFVKTLEALPRYRAGTFRGWLFAIAHNVVAYGYRIGRPISPLPDTIPLPDTALMPSFGEGRDFFNYYVFAHAGDRWSIDEAVGVRDFLELEIVARDGGFAPADLRVADDRLVRFVVRNEGTTPHSFVPPVGPTRIEAGPGETKSVEVPSLSAGTWPFFSDIPGDREAGLVGTLIVAGATTSTPELAPAVGEAPGPSGPALASATIEANPPSPSDPGSLSILADRDVEITVRNIGSSGPANFTIDPLGVSVDVAQGETEEITINAPAGVYAFHSTVPGHAGAGMFGTLFAVEEVTPTPG